MSTARQRRQRMKNHTTKWHPNLRLFAPRGNSDPTSMERRLKDALTHKPHGDVKIYSQEEIAQFSESREKQQ